jgi:hypothetical protein
VALASLHSNPVSKKLGGAPSSAETRTQSSATVLGVGDTYAQIYVATASERIPMTEPLIIPPANGLILYHEIVASTLRAALQFYEKPI